MAKKPTLGLGLFFNNSTNSGIVNYIYNIIAALNTLDLEIKPSIFLFHNEDAELDMIKNINYIDIKFILVRNDPRYIILRKLNNAFLKMTTINLFLKYYNGRYKLVAFYPYFPYFNQSLKYLPNKVEWLVDFNNKAYPQFYEDNAEFSSFYQDNLVQSGKKFILSSYSLLEELKNYYPTYANEVHVLRFASSLPDFSTLSIEKLKNKYDINDPYFMSPNQFWEHKNQMVVLQAIRHFKFLYPSIKIKVIFTGSLDVNRGKGKYSETLLQFIRDHQLEQNIYFLGVLERKEQLTLMKNAIALIQPSFYEGWSTLVEEAKALNKYIILSDLKVHREQISKNVSFFDPNNFSELCRIMYSKIHSCHNEEPMEYNYFINRFANDIVKALIDE